MLPAKTADELMEELVATLPAAVSIDDATRTVSLTYERTGHPKATD